MLETQVAAFHFLQSQLCLNLLTNLPNHWLKYIVYFHALKTNTIVPSAVDKHEKQSRVLCYVRTDNRNIRILDMKVPLRQWEH
jgi:hypothetical protein